MLIINTNNEELSRYSALPHQPFNRFNNFWILKYPLRYITRYSFTNNVLKITYITPTKKIYIKVAGKQAQASDPCIPPELIEKLATDFYTVNAMPENLWTKSKLEPNIHTPEGRLYYKINPEYDTVYHLKESLA